MKVIVVGAGGVARVLLARLSEMWEATVVDKSPERLERLETRRPLQRIPGDGSSGVVLERAGLSTADAVIAASDDDGVNLEVCRLARRAGVRRLVALVRDVKQAEHYRELEVPTIQPAQLAARAVESHLERRRVNSTAFADGRAEAIEFRVAPDSPVAGKSLRELHAASYVVGAILRRGRLVLPHGDTVLEEDDLVTVVGAGSDFAEIVRTFTAGEERFPLDFGKRVAIALDDRKSLEGCLAEAFHMVRNSRATSLLQVHRDPAALRDPAAAERAKKLLAHVAEAAEGVKLASRPVAGRPSQALKTLPRDESVGVIVLRGPRGKGVRATAAVRHAAGLARRTGRPVLLARGTQPYKTIVVPARHTAAGRAAIRAGIDLARIGGGSLRAVLILDPGFIAGPPDPDEERRTVAWLEEEAAAHGVAVEPVVRPGNPVRGLVEAGRDANLIVLGVPPRRITVVRARIPEMVARRTDRSVLFVPVGAKPAVAPLASELEPGD